MSLSALASSISAALPAVNFHSHGHRKGALTAGSATSTGNSSGIRQLPVGASTSLFSNLLQSLQQTIGAQPALAAAASATSAATGATAPTASINAAGSTGASAAVPSATAPAQQQELQAFAHSLFQALKQEPSGAPVTPSTAVAATSGSGAATAQYQSTLVPALQALIQQLGPDGKSTAATQTLKSTFENLVNGVNGAGAAASSQGSSAGLQNFLNGFLQNLQTNGVHALNSVGNNVNANI